MVKTLRRKFIVITMLVIFFVLGGIVGVINVVNYTRLNENAAATMRQRNRPVTMAGIDAQCHIVACTGKVILFNGS